MVILLAVLAALALALLLAAACFFRTACLRSKHAPPPEENLPNFWKPYETEIRDGIRWFRGQEPEQVELTSYDGLKLRGQYLHHPSPRGTILLCHGYRSSGELDFSCAFRFYYELGYSILCITERAHGGSEGRWICFGVRERHDCRRWAEYVCERFGPGHPIFLGGISMGCTTVLMAAGLPLPPSVCGVIADCGFTSPWEEFRELLRSRYRLPAHPLLDAVDLYARLFAGFGLRECSTLDAMRTNSCPVLFVHGGSDHYVTTRFSRENYQACRAEKRLIIVPDAGHGMSYLLDTPGCQAALRDFLAAHTPKEAPHADDSL